MKLAALFLVLVFAGAAHALTPALAVGDTDVCLLASDAKSQAQVKCWDLNGWREEQTPHDLHQPTSLVANERNFCVIHDGGRMRCWTYQRNIDHRMEDIWFFKSFAPLRKVRKMAGGQSENLCVWDEDQGFVCSGNSSALVKEVPTGEAAKREPREIAVQSYACAILAGGQVQCWGQFDHQNGVHAACPGLKQVPEMKAPRQLIVGKSVSSDYDPGATQYDAYCYACALDGDQFTCWGDTDHWKKPELTPTPFYAEAYFLRGVWLDGGELHSKQGRVWPKIGDLQLLASERRQFCAADARNIYCSYPGYPDPGSKPHGLTVNHHDPAAMPAILQRAVPAANQAKQSFFATAAQLATAATGKRDRFFVYYLAGLLGERTDSEYFTQTWRPRYLRERNYWAFIYEVRALGDFPLDAAHRVPAASLLRTCLGGLAEGPRQDLESAIGALLASRGEETEPLRRAMRRHAKDVSAWAADDHSGLAATAQDLLEYLNRD